MTLRNTADRARQRLNVLAHTMGAKVEAARVVSSRSGLSHSWVYKFMVAEIDNPTINQLDTLIDALDGVQDGGIVRQ